MGSEVSQRGFASHKGGPPAVVPLAALGAATRRCRCRAARPPRQVPKLSVPKRLGLCMRADVPHRVPPLGVCLKHLHGSRAGRAQVGRAWALQIESRRARTPRSARREGLYRRSAST